MSAAAGPFDLYALSSALERARSDRDLTWVAMSREVGVAASTIRRYASATDAEADGVLALIGWLDVPPERFVAGSTVAGTPLPPAGEGMIRVDMARLRALCSPAGQSPTATRTTIQRLVSTAQASQVSVASLTRWSST